GNPASALVVQSLPRQRLTKVLFEWRAFGEQAIEKGLVRLDVTEIDIEFCPDTFALREARTVSDTRNPRFEGVPVLRLTDPRVRKAVFLAQFVDEHLKIAPIRLATCRWCVRRVARCALPLVWKH